MPYTRRLRTDHVTPAGDYFGVGHVIAPDYFGFFDLPKEIFREGLFPGPGSLGLPRGCSVTSAKLGCSDVADEAGLLGSPVPPPCSSVRWRVPDVEGAMGIRDPSSSVEGSRKAAIAREIMSRRSELWALRCITPVGRPAGG